MSRGRPSAGRRVGIVVLAIGMLTTACRDDGSSDPTTTAAPSTTTPSSASTTTAADPTATTTSDAAGEIALQGDGLGVASFGDAPDPAIAAVTAALGAPTKDSGWVDAAGPFGICPGDRVRGVEWDSLRLLFADGTTELGTGPHLIAWTLNGAPPALATARGFGFGATSADAHELYGDAVEDVPADDIFPAYLRIDLDGRTVVAFLAEDGTVSNLNGGLACGD